MQVHLNGDPNTFAIEWYIHQSYERRSLLALGFFVIHVDGQQYGVRNVEASMLACSYSAVLQRIKNKGHHTSRFFPSPAIQLVETYLDLYFSIPGAVSSLTGATISDFISSTGERDLMWAPDGDEAFDDGGHVLQIDIGNEVRLIAFKNNGPIEEIRSSIREIKLPAETFYKILEEWVKDFDNMREQLTAVPIESLLP